MSAFKKASLARFAAPAALSASLVLLAYSLRLFRIGEFWGAGWENILPIFPPYLEVRSALVLGYLRAFCRVAILTFAFWGSGRALLKRLGLSADNPWESAALAFALGTGIWAYLFFLLGLLGLLYPLFLQLILVLGAAFGLWECRKDPPDLWKAVGIFRRDRVAWGAFAVVALHALILLPYALVPETFYDSVEYHLGLPHLYLLRHAITPTPDNSFSGVPSVPSMLFGWALATDRWGIAAHLFNFTFLLWTVVAITGLAIRFKRPAAGPFAAALFVAMPVVSTLSYMTTVELAWGLYLILCLPVLIQAVSANRGGGQRRAWLTTAGILLGLAMSTKYLAWALPMAFLTFAFGGRKESKALTLRECGWVAGTAAILLAPWILKNLFFYHNPIFPFLHEVISPSSEVQPGWRYLGSGATFAVGSLGPIGYLKAVLKAPLGMIYYNDNIGDSMGPLLLALLPLWGVVKLSKGDRQFAWFLLGSWLPLAFVSHLPRYYVPMLGLSCLFASLPVFSSEKRWFRYSVFGAFGAALLAVLFCFWRWVVPRSRWPVFTGAVSVSQFLSHASRDYYPAPLFPAAEHIRRTTGEGAKVLVFGDSRGFYLMRDHVNSTPMQVTVLERWANAAATGDALKKRLDSEGITHIIVNHAEIVRQRLALRFSEDGKRALDDFWSRYTLKVFEAGPNSMDPGGSLMPLDQWVVAYKILSAQEAARPHPSDDLFADYTILR